jgi:hypothetical protein
MNRIYTIGDELDRLKRKPSIILLPLDPSKVRRVAAEDGSVGAHKHGVDSEREGVGRGRPGRDGKEQRTHKC